MSRTRGQRLYDRWSRHPLLFRAGYELAFGGQYGHLRRTAVDALALAPGDAALDVACGWGRTLARLSDRVGPTGLVVGVDYSAGMVAAAGERARSLPATRDVRVLRGDAQRLPLGDERFDAAHCALSLTAMPAPARAIRAVHRVLRPGGRFVVFDTRPFQEEPWTALNPLVAWGSALATNWRPEHGDAVVAALRETFETVDVAGFNRGTAYVATAEKA